MTFSAICVYSGMFFMMAAFCLMMMPSAAVVLIPIRNPDLAQSTEFATSAKTSANATKPVDEHHTGNCSRCNGSGLWMNLPNRTCYRCDGSGIDPN
ncbi:MAG: hypothetical protein M0Z78_08895 [Betaproteobacteria bacterium]|nr:hypothetical protein [Betaproteobacteria bacterium]